MNRLMCANRSVQPSVAQEGLICTSARPSDPDHFLLMPPGMVPDPIR
jgi:hypothetical protein